MTYYSDVLPEGITSRTLTVNDLEMHILEAGDLSLPLILLLHGFPELAFSWRKVLVPLSQKGYHVVAPDQRGYGRTISQISPSPIRYEDNVHTFRILNIVRDAVALVFALGYATAATVVGHDLGSGIAAYCSLIRPDVFQSVVLMSTPFQGPPPALAVPSNPVNNIFSPEAIGQLLELDPPRKYYIPYFSGPDANDHFMSAPQGLHAFLRAYFHAKSADWQGNYPHLLRSRDAGELTKLPHYYMMPSQATMPEAVAPYAPSAEEVKRNQWLSDNELAVYVAEYGRTGFQGGFNWYRAFQAELSRELGVFAGMQIGVPAMFVSGDKDWGIYQTPGALERMQSQGCKQMDAVNVVLLEGAGHWVQQEQAATVVGLIGRFLDKI